MTKKRLNTLIEMVMVMTNKLQFNLNCDERPEWLDSDNKQLLGDVDMTLISEPFIPINPETKEPYYHSVFEENDAVWVGRKVKPIKPK